MMTPDRIAKVCHEANRAYCAALGDQSQPTWNDAPGWQKKSVVAGVIFHLANPLAGDEASHEEWLRAKRAEGWVVGAVKDAEAKVHPNLVPFHQLPKEQQAKDALFRAVVHALA